MPHSAVQSEVPIPVWARSAMGQSGIELPKKIGVMLASYAGEEAPVVIEVQFPDAAGWPQQDPMYRTIARLLPAPENTTDPVAIRMVNGRLFAPFAPAAGDDPYTVRTGRGRRHDLASLLGWCWIPSLAALNPFLELPLQPVGPRGQRSDQIDVTQFLTGPTVPERIAHRANEDAILVDGILHIAVHEPVWRFDSVPELGARRRAIARICIPLSEPFEARFRVRLDRPAEASHYFTKCLNTRGGVVAPVEFSGSAELLRGITCRRDDATLVASDVARTMLVSTASHVPRLSRAALVARADLAKLDRAGTATSAELFSGCDLFATTLELDKGDLGPALRAYRQSVIRRACWNELGYPETAR